MRVTEALATANYWNDPRFQKKQPMRRGSRKQSCGDNIYFPAADGWGQLDSFHSHDDGSPNEDHIARDTGTNRILISDEFVYFGGEAPEFPAALRNFNGIDICKRGMGQKKIEDPEFIENFEAWFATLGSRVEGFPLEWQTLRKARAA
jgi:hypothetical protein